MIWLLQCFPLFREMQQALKRANQERLDAQDELRKAQAQVIELHGLLRDAERARTEDSHRFTDWIAAESGRRKIFSEDAPEPAPEEIPDAMIQEPPSRRSRTVVDEAEARLKSVLKAREAVWMSKQLQQEPPVMSDAN